MERCKLSRFGNRFVRHEGGLEKGTALTVEE